MSGTRPYISQRDHCPTNIGAILMSDTSVICNLTVTDPILILVLSLSQTFGKIYSLIWQFRRIRNSELVLYEAVNFIENLRIYAHRELQIINTIIHKM